MRNMASVRINDQRFELHQLEPFGVELRPLGVMSLNLLEWTNRDLLSVCQLVRKHLFCRIADVSIQVEQWEHLEAPNSYYSARMWHYDGRGDFPVVAWAPVQGMRNPTAFVKRDDLVEAQRYSLDLIDPERYDSSHPLFMQLASIFHQFSARSSDIRLQELDHLYVQLVYLSRMDRLIDGHQKTMMDRLTNFFFSRPALDDEDDVVVRQKVMDLVLGFADHVTETLADTGRLMEHPWNAYPEHAVMVYNGLRKGSEDSTGGPMPEVLHRRIDRSLISDEADLLRLRLVVDEAGNMYWAEKSVPAF